MLQRLLLLQFYKDMELGTSDVFSQRLSINDNIHANLFL